jgi:putative membrane protein insertion efficiency factor
VKRAGGILKTVRGWAREAFLAPVHLYTRVISPALPQRCKYYPSCSNYAVQAIRELGIVRGTILAAWRLARCNPWSHGGVDELSDRRWFRDGTGHACTEHPPGEHGVAT